MLLSIVATQSSDSLFQLGNTYYENEQYETAASTYEQLENDYSHEYLYLNLGNSYYRMGELGNAVWAYEKAYSIAPRDQDIIYNLNFVTHTNKKNESFEVFIDKSDIVFNNCKWKINESKSKNPEETPDKDGFKAFCFSSKKTCENNSALLVIF